jgi:hypothetical protein
MQTSFVQQAQIGKEENMENQFATFIKPYLRFIDTGNFFRKPFSILYALMAVVNLLLPVYLFYFAVSQRVFSAPGKFIAGFLLVWVFIAVSGCVSFQIWWDRKDKVIGTSTENDKFVATPVFSHFIQTTGEWIGTWVGIVGFGVALLSTISLGEAGGYVLGRLGLNFLGTGILSIVLMPAYGFLIIVTTRFLAEQFRALATIANNTERK